MNDSPVSAIILGAAAAGLLVNTLTVLGVAWRGGRFLGKVDATMSTLSMEVVELRKSREEDHRMAQEQARLLERVTVQVEHFEGRIRRIEDRG